MSTQTLQSAVQNLVFPLTKEKHAPLHTSMDDQQQLVRTLHIITEGEKEFQNNETTTEPLSSLVDQ